MALLVGVRRLFTSARHVGPGYCVRHYLMDNEVGTPFTRTLCGVLILPRIVKAKPNPNALPIIDGDGAVGDPASELSSTDQRSHADIPPGIGVAVELTNWTRADRGDHEFSTAAGHQLTYLLDVAPRTSDGAISHRSDQVQLW